MTGRRKETTPMGAGRWMTRGLKDEGRGEGEGFNKRNVRQGLGKTTTTREGGRKGGYAPQRENRGGTQILNTCDSCPGTRAAEEQSNGRRKPKLAAAAHTHVHPPLFPLP